MKVSRDLARRVADAVYDAALRVLLEEDNIGDDEAEELAGEVYDAARDRLQQEEA